VIDDYSFKLSILLKIEIQVYWCMIDMLSVTLLSYA